MTLPYAAEESDRPGEPTMLAQRYELLELVGRGGMAEVFRARDHALQRIVAVKLLPVGRRDDDNDACRLQNEARAAASVSHPHVVAVHDVGSSPDGVFVVMELLAGRTWREELRERGPWTEQEAARVGAQVASALAAAHAHGVLHRDVKPANVMLLDDGTARLMDFGIARLDHVAGLTETGKVMGTPDYMAPEQVRGEALDGRCDVYSLGCALYEAVTGRPPFHGLGSADTAWARLREPPVPPRQVRPGISIRMEDLIMRAMALHTQSRPDAATLSTALQGLAEHAGRGTHTEIVDDETTLDAIPRMRAPTTDEDAEPTTEVVHVEQRPSPKTRPPGSRLRRAGAVLVAVGLVAIVALVLWLALR